MLIFRLDYGGQSKAAFILHGHGRRDQSNFSARDVQPIIFNVSVSWRRLIGRGRCESLTTYKVCCDNTNTIQREFDRVRAEIFHSLTNGLKTQKFVGALRLVNEYDITCTYIMLCLKGVAFFEPLLSNKGISVKNFRCKTVCLSSPILSHNQQVRFIRSFENAEIRTIPRTNLLLDQRVAAGRLVWSNRQRNFNLIQRFNDLPSSLPPPSPTNPLNKKEGTTAENGKNNFQQPTNGKSTTDGNDSGKLSIFKRFKILWKKYWYILIPVHLITSTVWLGCFYYLSYSGVDVVGFLEHIGFGETIVNLMKKYPSGGYLVLAYALYKIRNDNPGVPGISFRDGDAVATPARYFVTVSGTHYAIKYLSRMGYIKPVPTKDQMSQFICEQKRRHKDKLLKIYKQKRLIKRSWFRNKNER
uniref:DUF1279 domain-containing protein n=1 Tax=Romanomermis culicivorax TaxID=13658 RepID=A0A915IQ81_ROMCU